MCPWNGAITRVDISTCAEHSVLAVDRAQFPPVKETASFRLSLYVCREDSDPRYITNAADVKLRSFTTRVTHRHQVIQCTFCFLEACLPGKDWLFKHGPCKAATGVAKACKPNQRLLLLQVHKIDALVSYRADIED